MLNPEFESFRHFCFDLDGTLLDSYPVMEESWESCRERFSLEPSFEDYKRLTGRPFGNILKALKIQDKIGAIERAYFEETQRLSAASDLHADVLDLLNAIEAGNSSWSIVTGKPRAQTVGVCDRLGLTPQLLVCGDDFHFGKPDARLGELVANFFRVELNSVIYFGDTLVDYLFAINSGFSYCHCDFGGYGPVPSGLHPYPTSIGAWNEVLREQ